MNALYVKGAERMLAAALLGTLPAGGTLTAALVSTGYSQSLSADEFFDDISAYVLGTPQALANITISDGKLDADDSTFAAVAAGDTAEAAVLYMNTGDPATSWLLARIDQLTSFPYATDDGDIVVRWDNGTYKIVALV